MLTVVGLGNPGASYKKTRHNAGFMLIDGIIEGRFIERAEFSCGRLDSIKGFFGFKGKFRKTSGLYVDIEGELSGTRFILVKPTTFMNEAGRAFASLRTRGIIQDLSEVLVVVDDVDLEVGRVKLRQKGSAGGHNGLKSIIGELGTDEFTRLRIGVGPRPDGSEMVDYVLSTFRPEEFEMFEKSLYTAAGVVEAWITDGYENANNILSSINKNKFQGDIL